nr:SDR family NAD(P)-dependent oxidoreductase [uncultured Pedobacter sp.]
MKKKTFLIIGASSGVGKKVLEILSVNNHSIFTISRKDISSCSADHTHFRLNITKYKSLFKIIEKINNQNKIDVIINCVGVGFYAPMEGDFSKYWKIILETNILGFVNLLSSLKILKTPTQHLIHIGSLAAYRPSKTPGNLIYSCSKTAVLPLISEFRHLLRMEKKATKVTLITPGFIEGTNFDLDYFTSSPDKKIDLYSDFKGLDPVDIANMIMYVISLPEHVEINEIITRPTLQID